jgi:plasmid stabilization system protein ParE
LPIDPDRIRDRLEAALANGPLAVSLAEGEISVAAGQARLANTTARAQGAGLKLQASADLAAAVIDARLVMTGPERPDAPGGARPEIGVTLKGPIAAPKRTLDVDALASWLALRAVEQQARRIDALESGREEPAAPAVSGPLPPANEPVTSAVPPRPVRIAPDPPRPRSQAPVRAAPLPPPIDIRPAPAVRAPAADARTQ